MNLSLVKLLKNFLRFWLLSPRDLMWVNKVFYIKILRVCWGSNLWILYLCSNHYLFAMGNVQQQDQEEPRSVAWHNISITFDTTGQWKPDIRQQTSIIGHFYLHGMPKNLSIKKKIQMFNLMMIPDCIIALI